MFSVPRLIDAMTHGSERARRYETDQSSDTHDDAGARRRSGDLLHHESGVMTYPPETRDRALQLYRRGERLDTIEAATGATHQTICRWARQAGILGRAWRKRGYAQATRRQALQLYRSGATLLEIEAATGACRTTIRDWARRAGLTRPTRLSFDLDALWEHYIKHGNLSAAARHVGISHSTAHYHVHGRRR